MTNENELQHQIKILKRALKKIIEAGDLWGSEGKQHHEAIYLARCAMAQTSPETPIETRQTF